MAELLPRIDERNNAQDLESNLDRSFNNLKYDMNAMNSWLYYLQQNHENIPKRLEDLAFMVNSLEENLFSIQSMFNDLSTLNKTQASRLSAVESKMIEISEVTRADRHAEIDRLEIRVEQLLNELATKLDSIKPAKISTKSLESKIESVARKIRQPTRVIRTVKTVKIRPKARKKVYYGTGAKGTKFHLSNCLIFKRLKNPKKYKSIGAAQKAGMRYCSLCEPTLTRR